MMAVAFLPLLKKQNDRREKKLVFFNNFFWFGIPVASSNFLARMKKSKKVYYNHIVIKYLNGRKRCFSGQICLKKISEAGKNWQKQGLF
jgi:hypothetical protein